MALLMILAACVPAAAQTAQPRKTLSAVYVYDGSKVTYYDDDAASIDQMFYSFALLQNGHLSAAHWENINAFQAYIRKHPQIEPILSIGGWGADGFSQAASTQEGRALFAQESLQLMQEYGFTGVDIDWEYPGSSQAGIASSPQDKENYTFLLQTLREALDAQTAADGLPRRLCIAISGAPWLIQNLQCEAIGRIVDQVNLMTYDMHMTALASHHSALYAAHPKAFSAAGGAQAYIEAGIPAAKIMIGAAFYGHRWRTNAQEPLYQEASLKNTLTYTQIQKLLQRSPEAAFYDETAQAPYYFDGKVFISYDNIRSITQKRLYAAENGLLGLFAWQYGSDTKGELVHALSGMPE